MILTDADEKREAVAALGVYAVNGELGRNAGDAVHEEVTEGRRSQYERAVKAKQAWALKMPAGYSSCGDLAHWALKRLGCRDETLVNRSDDGGSHPWLPGANTTMLGGHKLARRTGQPCLGALCMVNNSFGGHVLVITAIADDGVTCTTAEYGQPYGRQHTRVWSSGRFGTAPLLWWIDPADVPCSADYQPPNAEPPPREARPPAPVGSLLSTSEVQAALKRCGFDPGPVDGKAGLRTIAAVRAFQAKAGLVADGIVGPATRAALKDALARA